MSYTEKYNLECEKTFEEKREMFKDFLTLDFEQCLTKYAPERLDDYYDCNYGPIDFVCSYSSFGYPTEHKPLISGNEINRTYNKTALDDGSCYAELVVNQNPTVKYFIGSRGDAWISAEEMGGISKFERVVLPTTDCFKDTFYYEAMNDIYTLYDGNYNTYSSLENNVWIKTDEDIDRESELEFINNLNHASFKDALSENIDYSALSVVDKNAFVSHLQDADFDFQKAVKATIDGKDYDLVKNDTADGSFRVVQKEEVIEDFFELRRQIEEMFDDGEFAKIADYYDIDVHKLQEFDESKVEIPEPKKQKEKVKVKTKFTP